MNPIPVSLFIEELQELAIERDKQWVLFNNPPWFVHKTDAIVKSIKDRNTAIYQINDLVDLESNYEMLSDGQYWPIGYSFENYMCSLKETDPEIINRIGMKPRKKSPDEYCLTIVQLDLVTMKYSLDEHNFKSFHIGYDTPYTIKGYPIFDFLSNRVNPVHKMKYSVLAQAIPHKRALRIFDYIALIEGGGGDQEIEEFA